MDVVFAQDAVKAWSTFTHEAVDIVLAEGAVLAGLAGALVHVGLTPLSLESQTAPAGEAPDVVDASAAAQAWIYREAAKRELLSSMPNTKNYIVLSLVRLHN